MCWLPCEQGGDCWNHEVEEEEDGSSSPPEDNIDEGDGTDSEDQVETPLIRQIEHQTIIKLKRKHLFKLRMAILREHGEETTSMMVEDEVQVIVPPVQV